MIASRLTLALVFLCATAWAETSPSTVTCKDGTTSNGGRGACRGHGGVDKSAAGGATAVAEPSASTATVTCKDGSTSKAGRGACHGHGGVDKTKAAATSEPPAPANASAPPASTGAPPPSAAAPLPPPTSHAAVSQHAARSGGKAATDDPTGAIAKCKDGKYWHGATHSGSCGHHGGVDTWLDGSK